MGWYAVGGHVAGVGMGVGLKLGCPAREEGAMVGASVVVGTLVTVGETVGECVAVGANVALGAGVSETLVTVGASVVCACAQASRRRHQSPARGLEEDTAIVVLEIARHTDVVDAVFPPGPAAGAARAAAHPPSHHQELGGPRRERRPKPRKPRPPLSGASVRFIERGF